jgi:hypothetical protein
MPTKAARYWRSNILWQLFQMIVLNWKILKIVALEIRFDYRLLIAIRKQVFMLIGLLVVWRLLYVPNVINSETLYWLERIVFTLTIVVVARAGAIAIDTFIAHFIVPLVERTKTRIDDIIVYLFRTAFVVAVWMIAAVISLKILSGLNVEMIFAGFGICVIFFALAARKRIEKSMEKRLQKQGFQLLIKIMETSQIKKGIELIQEIARKTSGITSSSVLIESFDNYYVIVSIVYKLQKGEKKLAVKKAIMEEITVKFEQAGQDLEIAVLPETNFNQGVSISKKAA